MGMIPLSSNPVFNPDMTALETTTPAYAPTFNDMYRQCLENDIANRRDARVFEDPVLGKTFTMGLENGLVYFDDGEPDGEIYLADKETLDSVKKNTEEILSELGNGNVTGNSAGTGIPPQKMRAFKVTAENLGCTLVFNEPDDTVIDGQCICTVRGCIIRMSTGGYPATVRDGDLVIDNRNPGAYSKDGYRVSGLKNGVTYYFRAFPYSDHGVYNIVDCNENKAVCTLSVAEQVTVNVSAENGISLGEVTVSLTNTTNPAHSQTYKLNGAGSHTFFVSVGESYYISLSNAGLYVPPEKSETFTAQDGGSRRVEMQYIRAPAFSDCSWEVADRISRTGLASRVWEVGDEKTIPVNGKNYKFVILGFNHDELAAGGKAGVTIGMKNACNTGVMNNSATNANGWRGCVQRSELQNTIFRQLPAGLQKVIKNINKKTSGGYESTEIITTSDTLFLYSENEVTGNNSFTISGEGEQYPYFVSASQRMKNTGDNYTESAFWWLRSSAKNYPKYFVGINESGNSTVKDANIIEYISYGFCI